MYWSKSKMNLLRLEINFTSLQWMSDLFSLRHCCFLTTLQFFVSFRKLKPPEQKQNLRPFSMCFSEQICCCVMLSADSLFIGHHHNCTYKSSTTKYFYQGSNPHMTNFLNRGSNYIKLSGCFFYFSSF